MTVWVVHPVKDDLSAAEQYGEIKYINTGYVYPDELEGVAMPSGVMAKMYEAVNEFDPQTDSLLIVGDHLQIVQFTAMLAALYPEVGFQVLRFDREAKGYYLVQINPT